MRIVNAEDSAVVRAGLVEILADRGHEVAVMVAVMASVPGVLVGGEHGGDRRSG